MRITAHVKYTLVVAAVTVITFMVAICYVINTNGDENMRKIVIKNGHPYFSAYIDSIDAVFINDLPHSGESTLAFLDNTGETVIAFTNNTNGIIYDSHSKMVALRSSNVNQWHIVSLQQRKIMKSFEFTNPVHTCSALSVNLGILLFGDVDGFVHIYNINEHASITVSGQTTSPVVSVCIDDVASILFCLHRNGVYSIHDVKSLTLLHSSTMNESSYEAVPYHDGDSKWFVVGTSSGVYAVQQGINNTKRLVLPTGYTDSVFRLATSPDYTIVGVIDNRNRVWKIRNGFNCGKTYKIHAGRSSNCITVDNKGVVSVALRDSTVVIVE